MPWSRRQLLVAAVGGVLTAGAAACTVQERVVATPTSGPHRSGWLLVAHEALASVDRLWPEAVLLPVQIALPVSTAEFVAATGQSPGRSDIPAVTVGTARKAHVVVHPDAWGRLSREGRESVLAHEFTHLAMQGDGPVPAWLGEGLAEYTAHRDSALSPAQVAGSALRPVRGGRLPTTWPDPLAPGADRWQGYAMSWLACLFISRRWSEAALLRLYDVVQGGASLDKAMPSVLGRRQEQVLADWRAWLPTVS